MYIRENLKSGKILILPHIERLIMMPEYSFHINFRRSQEISAKLNDSVKSYNKKTNRERVYSFWRKPFLLVETIVFINFMVFKDQLIAISEYLYTPPI